MKNLATPPCIFIFISSSFTGELCSHPVRSNVRRTGRMFPEHVERSFLDPEYSFVAVRRILRTIFAKPQKFAQLRTTYIRRILPAMFGKKISPNKERALGMRIPGLPSRHFHTASELCDKVIDKDEFYWPVNEDDRLS